MVIIKCIYNCIETKQMGDIVDLIYEYEELTSKRIIPSFRLHGCISLKYTVANFALLDWRDWDWLGEDTTSGETHI